MSEFLDKKFNIEIDIFKIIPENQLNLENDIHVRFRTKKADFRFSIQERTIGEMIICSGGYYNSIRVFIDTWFTDIITFYFPELLTKNENPAKTYESLVDILEFSIVSVYKNKNIEAEFKVRIDKIDFVVKCE